MILSLQDLARVLAVAGGDAADSLQIVQAARLAMQHYPQLDPGQPALVTSLSGPDLASRVRQVLSVAYPTDHPVRLVEGDQANSMPLAELGEQDGYEATACLYLPPLPQPGSYEALQEIVARLRAPDGCPWDRELTWDKLRAFLLEESHELLAALDSGNPDKVAEEQGDLLLQVAMQTQIAIEEGLYRSPEMIGRIISKLIRRHPHVFGEATVSGTDEVLANWEAIKREERESNAEKRSPLSGVPKALPALAQTEAYIDRISRLQAVETPTEPWSVLAGLPPDAVVTPDVVGEALFGIVAWARAHGVDAESALRAANARYAAEVDRAQGS